MKKIKNNTPGNCLEIEESGARIGNKHPNTYNGASGRRYLHILLPVAILWMISGLFSACTKTLELEPISSITSANYW